MPLALKLVNLEEDHPTVDNGLLRLDRALASARQERITLLKLIHGYGSSGVGGQLRTEVWKVLDRYKRAGTIREFIPGEQFRVSDESAWALLKRFPELKRDRDWGRGNRGITLVVL
jgi:hypothetical protein